MQQQLQEAQEEAKSITAEGSAGGGMVKAVADGENQIVSITIEKDVVDPDDIEMLQDLIVAAANEALKRVQDSVQAEISKITGGMSIPGMT